MGILEQKNTKTKTKNSIDQFNRRSDTAKKIK